MTSFDPRLAVRRLVVRRGNINVYDGRFNTGLNIISGENSSGKSTVLDFIFYGLGGDLSNWREAALLCSEVLLEVELNGRPAVFSREISTSIGRPMRIHIGQIAEIASDDFSWSLHPYRRSQSKESFSQVIFRLLGMPEATGDANSNITMHQLLRLLYVDQLSPIDRIFRFERFDTELTRQTVGDLLCGAYDNDLYRRQLRLREAEIEYRDATAEWRSALGAFQSDKEPITLDWIEAERAVLIQELNSVHQDAANLEEKIFNAEVHDGLTLKEQELAYSALVSAQSELLELRAQRDEVELEIVDSAKFIDGLKTKLDQLQDAEITANMLKDVSFVFCPACYAPIDVQGHEHACALCKTPFDRTRTQSRILAVINDIGLQIKQSNGLQKERNTEAAELDLRVSDATSTWVGLSNRYKLLNRLPSTEFRSAARVLYSRAGYLERQIEDLSRKKSLVERIDALSKARQVLNDEIGLLKEGIETGERRQREQLSRAYTLIADNTALLLRGDLLRQDMFTKASNISFSFGDDRLSVDGESFFSASSMVYLRNSFFAGFFKASLSDRAFRFPRFLMLDTLEDKGMEPERSHHFQETLADICASGKVNHQVIFATAMISPRLEDSGYVVDRFYTHNSRTLAIL